MLSPPEIVPELLNASHIIPWSKDIARRADPCNGIALNALYDRAFDRGLITFDESFRQVLCHAYKLGLIGRKGSRCKEQRREPGPVDPLSCCDAADGAFAANPAGRGPGGRGLWRLSSMYVPIHNPPCFAPTTPWPSVNPNL